MLPDIQHNRSTIQYSYPSGNIFLVQICKQRPDKAMCLLSLGFGCRLACADGPYRFIGYDYLVAVRQFHSGKTGPDLGLKNLEGLARLPFRQGFTDAQHRDQAGKQGAGKSPVDHSVGFAEYMPPLGMADDCHGAPEILQHGRRDLTGKGALFLPVDVLGPEHDAGAGNNVLDRGQRREWRRDHDVPIGNFFRGLHNRGCQMPSFVSREVHLPVSG